jgi:hypothetical protein
VSADDGKRIISVADARDAIREASGQDVSCSFLILVDPERRPHKLIAQLFVGREAADRVLLDNFEAIAAMMPPGMRHAPRSDDDLPYVLGYWTNADPGPTLQEAATVLFAFGSECCLDWSFGAIRHLDDLASGIDAVARR